MVALRGFGCGIERVWVRWSERLRGGDERWDRSMGLGFNLRTALSCIFKKFHNLGYLCNNRHDLGPERLILKNLKKKGENARVNSCSPQPVSNTSIYAWNDLNCLCRSSPGLLCLVWSGLFLVLLILLDDASVEHDCWLGMHYIFNMVIVLG